MNKLAAYTVLAMGITCVIGLRGWADDAKASKSAEQLLIQAQKLCPVSGEELDGHGKVSKATFDGKTLYLCCDDCKGKPADKEAMAKITANMIAAQKKCPVMGRNLPTNAPSVVVNGRTLFVCCKPCIKKIQADPKKYIAKTDSLLKDIVSSKN
jgi:YHS domain-containing protein